MTLKNNLYAQYLAVETKSHSSQCNLSGVFETYTASRTVGNVLKLVLGAVCLTDETSLRASGDDAAPPVTPIPVSCYGVPRSKLVRLPLPKIKPATIAGLVQGRFYHLQMIRANSVSFLNTHIVPPKPAELENHNYYRRVVTHNPPTRHYQAHVNPSRFSSASEFAHTTPRWCTITCSK